MHVVGAVSQPLTSLSNETGLGHRFCYRLEIFVGLNRQLALDSFDGRG